MERVTRYIDKNKVKFIIFLLLFNYFYKSLRTKFNTHLRYIHSGEHKEMKADSDYNEVVQLFPIELKTELT